MTSELKKLYRYMIAEDYEVDGSWSMHNATSFGITLKTHSNWPYDISAYVHRQIVLFANPKVWPDGR